MNPLPSAPRRILILKPSSLGDVIQAIPVLRLLKRHLPASEIHWWIDTGLSALFEDDPDLAGLQLFDRRRWTRPTGWPLMIRSLRRMRQLGFDWVIDLQALARSAIVAWLSRGRLIVGLEDPREGAPAFYDEAVLRPSRNTHAVDWYLSVLDRLGIAKETPFDWLPPRPVVAKRIRERWPVAGGRWIALQPGARWVTKRWPARHFQQLVGTLAARLPDVRFAILGSRAEADLGREVATGAPDRCLLLAGDTTLPEMVEWLRGCELLVTNDTGPMHAAAALGKPVLALFGPTEPRRTGPYGQIEHVLRRSLPCVPCFRNSCRRAIDRECLVGLSPREVADVALVRLAQATG
ncbi:MAG: glycosyltransferase family 9 protein [Verrucomicrobiae bacterium]|nr:glycosyltransferase family 9 protein [Verrucomicrobiae bacterium]